LKTPQPVVAEHALRFENRRSSRAALPLETADCRRCVEAHHPDRPGASWVVPEHPKNVYQVTRCGSASLPALSIEGTDLFLSLEPVVTDRVEDIPQIKLMRLTTVVAIHVCPVNWSSAN